MREDYSQFVIDEGHEMEKEGVVSKPNHKGMREVLLPDHRED